MGTTKTTIKRNLKDIKEILTLAKLNEQDVKPTSQTLYFTSEDLPENDYKLLQLDSYLQSEINEGNTLYIKGNDDDDVVICSNTRTFHITAAETSNSLLLAKKVKFGNDIPNNEQHEINNIEVCGIFYEYLEAVVGKPHVKQLNDLLNESIYKGPELEYQVDNDKLLTFEQISNTVQASNRELKEAIEEMNVVTIDGRIRLLDFEYHFRVLSYMFKLIDENSWKLDEIDYEETINALKDLFPREVICSLFEKYAKESKIIDGLPLYKYKEYEVCRFFAQVLLNGAGKFNLNEFLQAWAESVPEGMVPNEEMLYGLAVVDKKPSLNVVWAFDESNLPENINERFKKLFSTKEKWTIPEIAPYIKRLATEKLDVNALLAKHARASKIDGVKYYSAKHGK